MISLWIIPCKHDPSNPVIHECVDRIRQHHPDHQIVVVDSDSESHYEADALILRVKNTYYAQGAYYLADPHNSPVDNYYLIQDSLMVTSPWPVPNPLYTVRWFSDPPHAWGWDEKGNNLKVYGAIQLAKMGIPCPETYRGVFGPMWACTSTIMKELEDIGFWKILPNNKWEQSALERVTGIVLEYLGYDITVSLQGEHMNHFGQYDETYAKKLNLARA